MNNEGKYKGGKYKYSVMTVKQLKEELKRRHLKQTGRKTELIQRLEDDQLRNVIDPLGTQLEKKTVVELRLILKQNQLSYKGRKRELVTRVIESKILNKQATLEKYGFLVPKYKENKQKGKKMIQTRLT